MSVEYFPTKKIVWADFFVSQPPEGLTYEPNPKNKEGRSIGYPDKCLRVSNGKSYAFAWPNWGRRLSSVGDPIILENEDGTHFELFVGNQHRETGGVVLAALARHFGVRFVSQYAQLVGEDGDLDTGVWDEECYEAARLAREQ